MGRKILAVVVAIILATGIFLIFQMVATSTLFIHESPKNLEYMTSTEKAAYFGSFSTGGYITLLLGFFLGALAAGWIATKISKQRDSLILPLIVGIVLTLAGIVIFFAILPGWPAWFILVCLVGYTPFAMIGHRIAR